jgi:hypothetical protein
MTVELGLHLDLQELLSLFEDENEYLALKQNPRFYEMLPTSPEGYSGNFRMDPIDTLDHKRINVLLDNPDDAGQVFVDTAQIKLAFGSVYVLNDIIIFKGSCLICFFPSLTPC